MPLGVEMLELQKRVYADDPLKVNNSNNGHLDVKFADPSGTGNTDKKEPREVILYTDVTAAVYQEWTVWKKNKFGRIQERIMGIDSSKIYNYDTQSRNAALVKHAQRAISTIKKVEYVDGDNTLFRILWQGSDEGKEPYEIEYNCRASRECSELVSKILYLISSNRDRDNGGKR